jgi:hypothetical protein
MGQTRSSLPFYRPYFSRIAGTADAQNWLEVDLGSRQTLDAIKHYPANAYPDGKPVGR